MTKDTDISNHHCTEVEKQNLSSTSIMNGLFLVSVPALPTWTSRCFFICRQFV